jgi:hypothetical protein
VPPEGMEDNGSGDRGGDGKDQGPKEIERHSSS